GLVHYHFASLQALLTEAALSGMRDLADGLGQLLASAQTPEDALDLILRSLDSYDRKDPTSLLFSETYLAATREAGLRQAVGTLIADFCRQLAGWLGERGVAAPEDTAAVLAAAIDGVMLHRALNPGLTSASVAPVLRRILTPAVTGRRNNRKAGEDR
ncbi:MAG: TetR/AcrR family transcriptional regulator, partial [Pseudonocardiales bacterium]